MPQQEAVISSGGRGKTEGCQVSERTLFFAFFTVSPPTGGASQVSYQIARHWPGERKIVQIGDIAGVAEIEPGLAVITLGHKGGERWRKLASTPRWCREMAEIAAQFNPDTIVLEGASLCAYHWWLIRELRRAAPTARLIYHAHNVEYDLRKQKHSAFIVELTRWAEGAVLKGVDVATAVSAVDAARFNSLYGRQPLLLPNGVDLTWIRSASDEAVEALRGRYSLMAQTVLFMGGYAYRPNGEAIDFLIRDVFPALLRRVPSAQLLVLGGEVPYAAPWLVAPGVVPAEELPAFVRAAKLSVAPIFSGSGTRLKIIESLGAGVPVIATAKGVEGLPVEVGQDFIRAETAVEFVDAIATSLTEDYSLGGLHSNSLAIKLSWPYIVEAIRNDIGLPTALSNK